MSTTRKWLHGLAAAIIGGGASSVTSTLTAMHLAPQTFNTLSDWNIGQTLMLAGANLAIGGIFSAAAYLKQSPLPPEPGDPPATP